ncbi:hypothetical protein HYH02_004185 [Chlamydomonas schloesseri]|uniref:Uncharacterized protein n=1 Tax=Chlamydomonas schloesseri TaxID=2026947 RepID=A0A835WS35_9CHLO|nr:hypothetical protein HYH02_004185 [Chlamydomonas schloesseri]|eukprot:KAG2451590.1 hypothetical protein HYH02_004185 [Chlamydomonas schloesseri]
MVLAAVLAARQGVRSGGAAPSSRPAVLVPQLDRRQLMQQLGWEADNPRLLKRLQRKIGEMRAELDKGEEVPVTKKGRKPRDTRLRWVAWCRAAFLAMPGHTGTAEDVCTVLQADPHIAPLLDQSLQPGCRHTPVWKNCLPRAITLVPGMIRTGEKRGNRVVYRYDPQAGELLAAAAKRRKRARGKSEASMPHLGKEQ